MRGLRQSSRRPDQRSIYRSETRWSVRSVRTRVKGSGPAKCQHIAGVPLRPETAGELYKVYLTKGAFGTTSIEGNTLTEAEVRARLEGRLKLHNILEACAQIQDDVIEGRPLELSPSGSSISMDLSCALWRSTPSIPICDLPSQFSRLCSRTSTSPGYILSGLATDAPPG